MRYRKLGWTDIEVSEIGFGCGAVGGLMIQGDATERTRAVETAIEGGITYFDTARSYGDGLSETHLGWVLKELAPDVVVGTKVQLAEPDMDRIEQAVVEHVEGSLERLGREQVDLIYLHNSVVHDRNVESARLSVSDVEAASRGLRRVVDQGKARYWGINGLGEPGAVIEAVEKTEPFVIQACFNLLNPSGVETAPPAFPFQDNQRLIGQSVERGVGVVGIRILAAGALSRRVDRHPYASQSVGPIATSSDFAADVDRAADFDFLVEEGVVEDLIEAGIRYAADATGLTTALVGLSSHDHLTHALRSVEKGPLPEDALARIRQTQSSFGGGE